jgi:hypothetical protein
LTGLKIGKTNVGHRPPALLLAPGLARRRS